MARPLSASWSPTGAQLAPATGANLFEKGAQAVLGHWATTTYCTPEYPPNRLHSLDPFDVRDLYLWMIESNRRCLQPAWSTCSVTTTLSGPCVVKELARKQWPKFGLTTSMKQAGKVIVCVHVTHELQDSVLAAAHSGTLLTKDVQAFFSAGHVLVLPVMPIGDYQPMAKERGRCAAHPLNES